MIAALVLIGLTAIVGFWLIAYALLSYFEWRQTAKRTRRRRAQRRGAP